MATTIAAIKGTGQVIAVNAQGAQRAVKAGDVLQKGETLRTPVPGIIVFAAKVGARLQPGDLVAEIIDPLANTVHRVVAGVAGVLYARVRERYATAGAEVGKIAGAKPFRTGDLLGA